MKNKSPWHERTWRKIKRWEPLYWLRTHTIDRYHIIDLRGQDGYEWGWIDRSHAMYLACFKLLVDFVEQEDPTVGLRTEKDYRGDPAFCSDEEWNEFHRPSLLIQLEREQEIRTIYDWWKTGRDAERALCEQLLDDVDYSLDSTLTPSDKKDSDGGALYEWNPPKHPNWRKWCDEHDRLEKKDEEMLRRLIEVRQSLWT